MLRKRILFLAEGATLAHFIRPLMLAGSVDPSRYEIYFFAPQAFAPYLKNRPFITGQLASMPGEQFLANIAKGAPPFPTDVIREYVYQDLKLIRSIHPDFVIGDMRLSLPISSRVEGVPYAMIMNAYWSPYARRRSIIPALPLTRIIPPRLLGPMYKMAEPLAFAYHARQMNRVRTEFGIPPLPPDLRIMYTDADYMLYPDIPEFVPTSNLPRNHFYIGICPWTPDTVRPDWWEQMRADSKPKIFVTLGSSGALRVLPALLRALSRLPVSVIVATAGRHHEAWRHLPYVADLLPLQETAAESAVVVSHGGSSGFYPAIAAGTPVLGIPGNADQQLATATLEESGAGTRVRVEEASEKPILRSLEKLLFEPRYREAARRWSTVYARYDSGVLFRQFLSKVLGE